MASKNLSRTLDQATVTGLTLNGVHDRKGNPKRDHIFFDLDLKGFGVRVRYDNNDRLCKLWCVMWRIENVQGRATLGKFPRMNAATARSKADAWLKKVHEGINPAGERAIAKKAELLTFSKVVEMYIARQRDRVRPSTLSQVELYLTGPYFAAIHGRSFAKITRSDAASCLAAISKNSSRLAAHKQASALYVWAILNGHASENPFAQVERVEAGPSRERVLSESEIRTVWNALRDDDFGRVMKLLLLTGCRANEIGQLRWSEINLEKNTLTIPGERTKNHLAHTLPLSGLALEIIHSTPKREGRDFLFGKFGQGFTYWTKQQELLVESLGLEHWITHDLRRTAATHMAEFKTEPHIIEAILNHVSGHKAGVAGVYNRAKYADDIQVALDKWAAHVERITTGKTSKVVAFPKSA
jgi:integrase